MSQFKGKTILITGATGLIGSHIVDGLMSMKDVKVIALVRNEDKIKSGFKEYLENDMFRYIIQDITEPLDMKNEIVDYIFHTAGPMESKIILNSPLEVIYPNIFGTINCLELLRQQEINHGIKGKIVIFSSVTVYDNIETNDITVCEADTSITEKLETTGEPYSQSKRMAEVIARAHRKQYGTDILIARLSTVYGNTRFLPDTAFFDFIRKAAAGENIIINNSRVKRRDNIYIDDVISALIYIVQKGKSGEVYNVSSNGDLGNFAAIDEIAKVIVDVMNSRNITERALKSKVCYSTNPSNKRIAGVKMDNNKLILLGWTLKTDLKTGIEMTIQSFLNERS